MLEQQQLNEAGSAYLREDGFKAGDHLTERDFLDIFEAGARWAEAELSKPTLPPEVEEGFRRALHAGMSGQPFPEELK